MTRKLLVVVGTRPNFMKVTRLRAVAAARGTFVVELVHTGQHGDPGMSKVFLEQFGLLPDHALRIPEGSANTRIANIMLALEPVILANAPAAVVVVGDVDSTLAAALATNKNGTPLVHLESGLRSGDLSMPEEVNRILTDHMAQVCLVTEPSGQANLMREGVEVHRIHLVGNTMIDTLVAMRERIAASPILEELGLSDGGHVLVTMHRPSNVDRIDDLLRVVKLLEVLAEGQRVVFPIHPRTKAMLEVHGLLERVLAIAGLITSGPLDYLAFQRLVATSLCVVTDSGGIQEETTFLGIPCLTLRPTTERPSTTQEGSNMLLDPEPGNVRRVLARIRAGEHPKGVVPSMWDGHATERILDVLERVL
jgi:UDP-N-acetylglucosamine 2-epimerase (non-hydrolysing)